MTSKNFITLAALFGFLGVALGAFGTHGLAAYFAAHPDLESSFHTGTQYQMYHALALIAAAWVVERYPSRWSRWSGVLFAVGIVLFSGSLYVLSLFDLRDHGRARPHRRRGISGGLGLLGVSDEGKEQLTVGAELSSAPSKKIYVPADYFSSNSSGGQTRSTPASS